MNDFLAIFGSIIFAFGLGAGLMLFFGGKTTLNYLKVKFGRGSKVFIWVDTPTGRTSKVGTIEGEVNEGVVSWKYRGEQKLTELKREFVGDFLKVKYIALNVETPEKPYTLAVNGETPARSIDQPTFNNILKRALTRPSLDDDLQKKIRIILILLAVIGLGVLVVAFKVINIEQLVTNLGVI